MKLCDLLGIDVPVLQAPMAGVQGSAMALAVSNAGGLGALPCAMLTADAMRSQLAAIRAGTERASTSTGVTDPASGNDRHVHRACDLRHERECSHLRGQVVGEEDAAIRRPPRLSR